MRNTTTLTEQQRERCVLNRVDVCDAKCPVAVIEYIRVCVMCDVYVCGNHMPTTRMQVCCDYYQSPVSSNLSISYLIASRFQVGDVMVVTKILGLHLFTTNEHFTRAASTEDSQTLSRCYPSLSFCSKSIGVQPKPLPKGNDIVTRRYALLKVHVGMHF